jgi:hypothetical protein
MSGSHSPNKRSVLTFVHCGLDTSFVSVPVLSINAAPFLHVANLYQPLIFGTATSNRGIIGIPFLKLAGFWTEDSFPKFCTQLNRNNGDPSLDILDELAG